MNMPRFTAEASLGKPRGHYRTGRHAINLPTHMMSAIYLAMDDVYIYSCNPGFLQLGEGENTTCIPDPSWGGGGGGGTPPDEPSDGAGPYGGGSSGGTRPKKPKIVGHVCGPSDQGFFSQEVVDCIYKLDSNGKGGTARCDKGKMYCCRSDTNGKVACKRIKPDHPLPPGDIYSPILGGPALPGF